MPRFVTIDLFGKMGVGKTTIFELFAGDKFLKEGGNLSYDFRGYYAKCWILEKRWEHSMVFLADPKLEYRWKDLNADLLRKYFEPTNVVMIVTDSTEKDVKNIKDSFSIFPQLKRKLILFVIATMQDIKGRMSVKEIEQVLGIKDIIGINTHAPGTKEKVEKFMEKAVLRYFLMLSRIGGGNLNVLDGDEIGLNAKHKEKKVFKGKYTNRLLKKNDLKID